ncbi:MAG TPA: hypothetical protein PLO37_06845 [Candidatus Hydrogenedentes bacterium]|nr:hypothetical protein [Candidatus Hydrogenedentota bacterium]HPG66548.1 hypothetical protein [Candidatus Hydrogenedentota bacterium]
MSKVAKEKRNLLTLLLMVATLAYLVVLARQQGDITIMPPEPETVTNQRKSPDNAYYVLRSARDQLHKAEIAPQAVETDKDKELRRRQDDEPNAVDQTLGLWLNSGDPKLPEFLEQYDSVVRTTLKAFEKPYYLCPEIGTFRNGLLKTIDFRGLGFLLTARGVYRARVGQVDTEAFQFLRDAIRLGRMIASDGPVFSYEIGFGIQKPAFMAVQELAEQAPRDVLDPVVTAFKELLAEPVPIDPCIEFRWRMLDESLPKPTRSTGEKKPGEKRPEEYWREYRFGRRLRKAQRFLIKQGEHLRQMAALPFPQYHNWMYNRTEFRGVRHPFCDIPGELDQLVLLRDMQIAWDRGTVTVLALESYRRDHETYPPDLAALVPDYLDEVPEDPFRLEPMIYRQEGNSFWLYSVGYNRRDDHANATQEADMIIHKPSPKP